MSANVIMTIEDPHTSEGGPRINARWTDGSTGVPWEMSEGGLDEERRRLEVEFCGYADTLQLVLTVEQAVRLLDVLGSALGEAGRPSGVRERVTTHR